MRQLLLLLLLQVSLLLLLQVSLLLLLLQVWLLLLLLLLQVWLLLLLLVVLLQVSIYGESRHSRLRVCGRFYISRGEETLVVGRACDQPKTKRLH